MASTLTKTWKGEILDKAYNSSAAASTPTTFKVGINQTTALETDTDLTQSVPISGFEVVDDCEATTGWSDSADMTVSLNTSTFIIGSGSLNLTKDGTASVNASTEKTVTSLNFTSKQIELFFRIDDQTTLDKFTTTDCITIRYGSSSGDYYQWTKDKADLSTGLNYIGKLDTTNEDSTTGTPVDASMDYFLIQITTNNTSDVWAAGKVLMDDIRITSSDDLTKSLSSGYPIIDKTTLQVTMRGEINSTEAIGQNINGFAIFNTDGTPIMEGIDDLVVESKSNTDNLIFVSKTRLQ